MSRFVSMSTDGMARACTNAVFASVTARAGMVVGRSIAKSVMSVMSVMNVMSVTRNIGNTVETERQPTAAPRQLVLSTGTELSWGVAAASTTTNSDPSPGGGLGPIILSQIFRNSRTVAGGGAVIQHLINSRRSQRFPVTISGESTLSQSGTAARRRGIGPVSDSAQMAGRESRFQERAVNRTSSAREFAQ
jgi:hypothetical protein